MGTIFSYRVFNSGSNSQCLVLEGSSSGQNHLQTGKFRTSLNPSSAPLFTMFQLHTTDNTDRGLTVNMEISFWGGEVYRLCLHFRSGGWLGGATWQVPRMADGTWEAPCCTSGWHTRHAVSNPVFLVPSGHRLKTCRGFLHTSADACSVPALKSYFYCWFCPTLSV